MKANYLLFGSITLQYQVLCTSLAKTLGHLFWEQEVELLNGIFSLAPSTFFDRIAFEQCSYWNMKQGKQNFGTIMFKIKMWGGHQSTSGDRDSRGAPAWNGHQGQENFSICWRPDLSWLAPRHQLCAHILSGASEMKWREDALRKPSVRSSRKCAKPGPFCSLVTPENLK